MEKAEEIMVSGDEPQDKTSVHDSCFEYPITGARFNEDIYTLKVGWEKHVFIVHKSILCLSPVLACMTSSSFLEGVTKEIALPEDDADSFGRIIEHLYGNNDAALDFVDSDEAEKLADLYGLAEKYQLPGFKELVIQKLKQLDLLKENRMTFFNIAHQICQLTGESDEIFGAYFAQQALIHMASMSRTESEELSEIVYSGGHFARMICELQAATHRKSQLGWLIEKGSLNQTVADLEKAQRMHKIHHPSCYRRHVLL